MIFKNIMNKKHLLTFLLIQVSSALFAQRADATRIAIIGCHQQGRPAPALTFLAEKVQPAYTIWVGDNVYADTEKDAQHVMRQLQIMEAKPGFKELREQSKFMVTWDDHDYGLNNAGKDYKLKEKTMQIHRQFWRLENEIPADHDGVYYAKIEQQPNGKKIQFILLDGRYNRGKPGKNADALGEKQWKWLEEQLRKPADLRFIVSGYQVLLRKPTRWEAWIKLGKSRDRLYDLIKSTNAKGVVFITGDQHYVEVLHEKNVLGYDAYEIMASGINQTERPGRAPNRVAGPDLTLNSVSVMTIHWEGKNNLPPHIYFSVTDADTGTTTLEFRIPLAAVGL